MQWTRSMARMLAAAVALASLWAAAANAAVVIDLSRGNVEPLPIAITQFSGDEIASDIAEVIESDLEDSGLFRLIGKEAFLDSLSGTDSVPDFPDWQAIGAQALVAGSAKEIPGGEIRIEFRLWDAFEAEQIVAQEFTSRREDWRQVAHAVADAIYEGLSGEPGYFSTRIVYVEESGPKAGRIKRLAIMDRDGANRRFLTDGNALAITPRFSPTRQEIAYMSFEGGEPRVYLMHVETGRRELVGNFPGMTFAPRFSPDGRRIAMSLQIDGDANIYSMELASRKATRLTDSAAIDTAPSYSPDGAQIAFESDRGGRQQLYVMNADGTDQRRISFGQGNYSTPVWSPGGDWIAFTKRSGGRFSIGVMRPDGSGERILTEGYHNEGPTWAPNGRALMFFRESPGESAGPGLWSINLSGYNEKRVPTEGFASDPAWSPLLQ